MVSNESKSNLGWFYFYLPCAYSVLSTFSDSLQEDTIFLHLRQLSTGLPHPLAREPDIVLGKARHVWGKMSIMLEIVGPRLVLLMTWRGLIFVQHRVQAGWDTLLLINWWDGRIIQVNLFYPRELISNYSYPLVNRKSAS